MNLILLLIGVFVIAFIFGYLAARSIRRYDGVDAMVRILRADRERLEAALKANSPAQSEGQTKRNIKPMAANLQPLIDEVAALKTVEDSAIAFINGSAARTQAAIDAALANGATKEQLQPLQDEVDAAKASADALTAAITANTPAAPPA